MPAFSLHGSYMLDTELSKTAEKVLKYFNQLRPAYCSHSPLLGENGQLLIDTEDSGYSSYNVQPRL
jgi:hypothetical protein